jgi:hypothetical protein
MDPMDILGGLLGGGGNSKGGGLGGKILSELLKGGRSAPASAPRPRTPSAPTRPVGPTDPGAAARRLEDILGVAQDRHATRGGTPVPQRQSSPTPQTQYRPAPPPPRYGKPVPPPEKNYFPTSTRSTDAMNQNDEAVVLIRAMVNAAKADGRVTQDEQQAIIDRLATPPQEAIDFLRAEYAQPLDVREFAWSVPIGMEQQVYILSLAAMNLDTNPEADYLRELAHGLRLSPDTVNQIHDQYGAPSIF